MKKRRKQNVYSRPFFRNNIKKNILLLLLFSVLGWVAIPPQETEAPAQETESNSSYVQSSDVLLYANQSGDDLTQLYLKAIYRARHSIHLVIYGLSDPHILSALRAQSQKGISVHVVADAKASPNLDQKLGSKIRTIRRFGPGLMHQKLLVVDGKQLLIGSANLTSESLRMHGNLVTVINSEAAAKMAIAKAETLSIEGRCPAIPSKTIDLGNQSLEFWFLPDNREALSRIKTLLSTAKKTVQIAMFTWSNRELAHSTIQAAQRGIHVELVIDSASGKGSSAQIVKLFKQKGIDVSLSPGGPLLHHKFLLIDGEVLVNGSANWTQAAFNKNDDCFIILSPLNDRQKKQMQHLWKIIKNESTKV